MLKNFTLQSKNLLGKALNFAEEYIDISADYKTVIKNAFDGGESPYRS